MIYKYLSTINNCKLSVIVFSLFFSWLLAVPFQGQVLYAIANQNDVDINATIFWAIASHFLGLFTCGFIIRNIRAAKKVILFSIIFCMVGSSVLFFAPSVLWTISLLAMSFIVGASVAAWGFYLKKYTPSNERIKTVANGLIYSNILMIIINMVAINLSPYSGLILSLIMLGMALFFATRLPDKILEDVVLNIPESKNAVSPVKPLAFLCLFITIITINSGLMYQVINPAFEHHKWLVSWYWAVPYIIALFVMKKLPRKINRTYILYVALAMIGLSFIGFMMLDRSAISYLLVNTLMLGACGIYDLFWWSILGEMLDFSDNAAKTFGIGLSSNVVGVLLGGIIGNTLTTTKNQIFNSSVLALTVVFIILIVLPVLHKQLSMLLKNHVYLTTLSEMSPSERTEVIDGFTDISQLTAREREIAALLLKGRTYKMIAGELYLSENTVKTHIKNIYSKLNVKSKSELITLLIEKKNYISK